MLDTTHCFQIHMWKLEQGDGLCWESDVFLNYFIVLEIFSQASILEAPVSTSSKWKLHNLLSLFIRCVPNKLFCIGFRFMEHPVWEGQWFSHITQPALAWFLFLSCPWQQKIWFIVCWSGHKKFGPAIHVVKNCQHIILCK